MSIQLTIQSPLPPKSPLSGFGGTGAGPRTDLSFDAPFTDTAKVQKTTCLSMKLSKATETQRMSHRGFPVAVPYPSPHRATPAYVVVTSSDLDTSRNKASVSGLSWISRKNNDFHDTPRHKPSETCGARAGLGSDVLPNHAPVLFEAQLKRVGEAAGTVMRRRLPSLPPRTSGRTERVGSVRPGLGLRLRHHRRQPGGRKLDRAHLELAPRQLQEGRTSPVVEACRCSTSVCCSPSRAHATC